jgi:uncharacterized protein YecE (DUF72 family)
LSLLPKDISHVIDSRYKSWLVDETFALVDRYGASLCVHDMAGSEPPKGRSGDPYVGFHGGAGKYWGRYSKDGLLGWADGMVEQARGGRTAWPNFNNDIEGHAIHDARALRAMAAQVLQ